MLRTERMTFDFLSHKIRLYLQGAKMGLGMAMILRILRKIFESFLMLVNPYWLLN